ncbi:hypothetical protein LAZ67_2000062 [Cordylochernes scorpioides]|uniref:EF-hand domain-containing protein n=1 Tax=Cordylochernes scorpioides TaxID=51811 RepID=A0ABY6K0H0_9ARAC|nr:hypothetical protein LAZ67_2000062 [Cordylochernes scorpioides]
MAAIDEAKVQGRGAAEMKMAFHLLDKNKDGCVNASELKLMLENLGIALNDLIIQGLISQASRRDDGLVNEEEFLSWMSRHTVHDDVMEDLLAAFRVFDKDNNGYITRDELKVAMEMIGEPMSDAQLDDLLKETDVDHDGRINYEGNLHIYLLHM